MEEDYQSIWNMIEADPLAPSLHYFLAIRQPDIDTNNLVHWLRRLKRAFRDGDNDATLLIVGALYEFFSNGLNQDYQWNVAGEIRSIRENADTFPEAIYLLLSLFHGFLGSNLFSQSFIESFRSRISDPVLERELLIDSILKDRKFENRDNPQMDVFVKLMYWDLHMGNYWPLRALGINQCFASSNFEMLRESWHSVCPSQSCEYLCAFIKSFNDSNIWQFMNNHTNHLVMRAIYALTGPVPLGDSEIRTILVKKGFFDTIHRLSIFLTTAPTRHRFVDQMLLLLTASLARMIPAIGDRSFFRPHKGPLREWQDFMNTLLDTIMLNCTVPNDRARYWVRLFVTFVMSLGGITVIRPETLKFIADHIATKYPVDAVILLQTIMLRSVSVREFIQEGGFATLLYWRQHFNSLKDVVEQITTYFVSVDIFILHFNDVIAHLRSIKASMNPQLSPEMTLIRDIRRVTLNSNQLDGLLTRFAPQILQIQPYYQQHSNLDELVAIYNKKKAKVIFDQQEYLLNPLSSVKTLHITKWLGLQRINDKRVSLNELQGISNTVTNCAVVDNNQEIDIYTPLSFVGNHLEALHIRAMCRNHKNEIEIPTFASGDQVFSGIVNAYKGDEVLVNKAVSDLVLAMCKHPVYLLTHGIPQELMLIIEKIPMVISIEARLALLRMFAFGPEHAISMQEPTANIDFKVVDDFTSIREYGPLVALLAASQGKIVFIDASTNEDVTTQAWNKICSDLTDICLDSDGYPREHEDLTALGAVIAYHLKHNLQMNIILHRSFWMMIVYHWLPFRAENWVNIMYEYDDRHAEFLDTQSEYFLFNGGLQDFIMGHCLPKLQFNMDTFLDGFSAVGNMQMCSRFLPEPTEWWTVLQECHSPTTIRPIDERWNDDNYY